MRQRPSSLTRVALPSGTPGAVNVTVAREPWIRTVVMRAARCDAGCRGLTHLAAHTLQSPFTPSPSRCRAMRLRRVVLSGAAAGGGEGESKGGDSRALSSSQAPP